MMLTRQWPQPGLDGLELVHDIYRLPSVLPALDFYLHNPNVVSSNEIKEVFVFTSLASVDETDGIGTAQAISREEKILVFKLDLSILLSTFTKTLDIQALTNAYVTGMQEDIGLTGNDLNYLTAVYYISQLYDSRQLHVFLSLGSFRQWKFFGASAPLVARATETVAFTGVIFVIGSWYKRDELGTRMALFQISAPLYLSVPSWWLKKSEIELANKRLEEEGIMKIEKKINWRALTRVLKGWPWYCFVFAWCFDRHYTVSQINNYPTVGKAIAIILTVTGSYYADKTGDRFGPTVLGAILVASGSIILVVWNVSEGARFYAFFIDGAENAMSTFLMSWASDVVKHDSEARSIVTTSMNCIGQVFLAWLPIFTFNVTKAPRFTVGFIFSMVTGILHVVLACFFQVLDVRRKRKEKRRVLLIDAGHGDDADVIELDNKESSSSTREKH
ncbi:major facilitator superfamily domain-containing protein [Lipomyces starkeyi]